MRSDSKKRSANKSGAVLVTAVCVLIIMSILMTATVGYVSVNRKKTNSNYSHKQAYLTASTTLQGFVEQIRLATAKPAADGSGPEGSATSVAEQMKNINALKALAAANGGKGTTVDVTYNGTNGNYYKVGTTQLNIKQEDGSEDNLIVTAITTYGGVTEKVAAHISTTTKKKPARFTNTIEQIGKQSMYLDNLNVVGDTAILEQGNTTKQYSLGNRMELQGSLYIWGTVDGTQINSKLVLMPNILEPSRGSFIQISEDFKNYLVAEPRMKRGDGYNYVFINGTCLASTVRLGCDKDKNHLGDGYDVDLITHGIETKGGGSGWTQYGNVYCYDIDPEQTNTSRNGDFKVSGGQKIDIKGDVFIEGDLIIDGSDSEFKCTNLTVCGQIKGSNPNPSVSGSKKVGSAASLDKSGRGSVPTMEYTSEDYKYMPEDFFINRDNMSSGDFKSKYMAFYNGSNTKDMFKDFGFYEDPTTHATFNFHVTESCAINGGSYANEANGGLINNKGVKMDCARTVLIDVTDSTGDVLIMLKNGVVLARDVEIVVRNRSTKTQVTLEDGITEMQHKFNCYFVSDSGATIAADGETAKGVKKHKNSNPGSFSFECLCLYDFDTYTRMFDSSYYTKKASATGPAQRESIQNVQPKENFVYNPTHNTSLAIAGKDVYCPGASSIILLIGEGFSFGPKYTPDAAGTGGAFAEGGDAGSTNQSFIEATVYGPQGYFGIKTQHMKMNIINSEGQLYDFDNKPVLGLGVFIASVFNSKNESTYVYTEPSGNCVLANAKGSKEGNITGFELDRYDHY